MIFNNFVNIFETAIDNYAQLKKLSRRQRKLKLKPWITRGLLIYQAQTKVAFISLR